MSGSSMSVERITRCYLSHRFLTGRCNAALLRRLKKMNKHYLEKLIVLSGVCIVAKLHRVFPNRIQNNLFIHY